MAMLLAVIKAVTTYLLLICLDSTTQQLGKKNKTPRLHNTYYDPQNTEPDVGESFSMNRFSSFF